MAFDVLDIRVESMELSPNAQIQNSQSGVTIDFLPTTRRAPVHSISTTCLYWPTIKQQFSLPVQDLSAVSCSDTLIDIRRHHGVDDHHEQLD